MSRRALGLLIALAAAMPWLASDYLLRAILLPFLVLALAALGLNVLVGWCGQISLGSGAFMAIGAYAAYNVHVRLDGVPLPLALLAGGACATVVGVLFGLPSLRIKGLYLAVATLAVQFFSDWAFLRVRWLTHDSATGGVQVAGLTFAGVPLDTPARRYLLCLAVVLLFAWAIRNLVRGRAGREWMAIRDMDVAASVIGIDPVRAKLSAFAVSSFVIGVAGALWGFLHLGAWEPATFGIDRSFQLLFMVIIGGLGSVAGAFLGAAFMVVLPLALNQVPAWFGLPLATATVAHLELVVFGGLIVVFLVAEPLGLARLLVMARERLRARGVTLASTSRRQA